MDSEHFQLLTVDQRFAMLAVGMNCRIEDVRRLSVQVQAINELLIKAGVYTFEEYRLAELRAIAAQDQHEAGLPGGE